MTKSLIGITGWLDRRFYADYKTEKEFLREWIGRFLTPSSVVLDAGCGTGLFSYDYKERVASMIGCDLTPRIRENGNVHHAVMADLSNLPFLDTSFDLVFCRYVVEHLTEPQRVFQEIARVLKVGGRFVILTPSAYHYVSLIGRFTPHAFHEWVARMRGNRVEDTFPTVYRANTHRQLTNFLSRAQLRVVDYHAFEFKPNYLIMSPVTYAMGILYERLVNRFDILSPLRVNFIVVAQRTNGGA